MRNLKLILITMFMVCSYLHASAGDGDKDKDGSGIKRSEWSFRPEFTTNNVIYSVVGMTGTMAIGSTIIKRNDDIPWWFPFIGAKITGLSEVTYSEGYHDYSQKPSKWNPGRYSEKIKDNILDFGLIDYSIGYTVTYMSKEIPLGFAFKLAYEQQGFKAKMKNEDEYITFKKQMIVPQLIMKLRLGNYRKAKGSIWMVELGASYDYAINARGFYKGKDTVNNGITGIFGFGWGDPSLHFQLGLNWYEPFYNYFNQDYPGQSQAKAKPYSASLYWRYGF